MYNTPILIRLLIILIVTAIGVSLLLLNIINYDNLIAIIMGSVVFHIIDHIIAYFKFKK